MRIFPVILFICFLSVYSSRIEAQADKSLVSSSSEISNFFISVKNLRTNCSNKIKMMGRQGYPIEGLEQKLAQLPDAYDPLLDFAYQLTQLSVKRDFPYDEPFNLDKIKAVRPSERYDKIKSEISDREISDKIKGGVYGQLCGLVLGHPLEMHLSLPDIRNYLEGVGAWPLNDYVPAFSPTQKNPLRRDCIESMKGYIEQVKEDDDLNYLVINTKILEERGSSFTTREMAQYWHFNLSQGWAWGPENIKLFQLGGMFFKNRTNTYPEADKQETFVRFLNDGEEAIGAMIRGQAFGFACPGNPELAAEMAWKDGILTHTKTGLYAEMWLSATIAAAFTTHNPKMAILAGLGQIPEKSRYAECIRQALEIAEREKDWMEAWNKIDEKWGFLGHAGTLNETAAIINALIHGVDQFGFIDYEKVITIAVMQGWDTDCSGGMAGAIAGVLSGYHKIPSRWIDPLNDTYHSGVATERCTSIQELSKRLFLASKQIRLEK